MLRFEKIPSDFRPDEPGGVPNRVYIYRAKIPGGWLVGTMDVFSFVPDPNHEWDGSSLP